MGITRQLAQFIVKQSFSNIPHDVRRLAKYTIIDTLGCCIAGYAEAREECGWIINLIKDLGGNPESSVFMSGFKTSPPMAALANGTMIHSIDFDDILKLPWRPGSASPFALLWLLWTERSHWPDLRGIG
ncbi:MAG: MmgE/PrpD family protein [Pseudomonadota bacterium]